MLLCHYGESELWRWDPCINIHISQHILGIIFAYCKSLYFGWTCSLGEETADSRLWWQESTSLRTHHSLDETQRVDIAIHICQMGKLESHAAGSAGQRYNQDWIVAMPGWLWFRHSGSMHWPTWWCGPWKSFLPPSLKSLPWALVMLEPTSLNQWLQVFLTSPTGHLQTFQKIL